MVCALYKSVFAMMAALTVSSTDALCTSYAPWFHAKVTEDIIAGDLKLIGQYFSCFRTFETMMSGVNIIDVAASAGLKIAVGVQMNDLSKVDAEIKAVCDGYNRHPEAVEIIYVGNENVMINGFGTVSVEQLITYIKQVKTCTNNSVKVGTVQRITEWASTGSIQQLAEVSDKIGCNIYPFFSTIKTTAMAEFLAQWQLMSTKYDITKVQVTETGWPTGGSPFQGNQPSLATMQQYLNDFAAWSVINGDAYWFQAFDSTKSYSRDDFEMYFGLFTVDGTLKISVPPGSHGTSGQIPTSNSTTPAGTYSPTDAPGTESPTPAGTYTPTDAPGTPAGTYTNAPGTQSPAPGSPTSSNSGDHHYYSTGNSDAGDVDESPIPVNGNPAPPTSVNGTTVDYNPTNPPEGNVAQSPIPVPVPSTDGSTVDYNPSNPPAGDVAQSPIPVPVPSTVDYNPSNPPAGDVAQSPIPVPVPSTVDYNPSNPPAGDVTQSPIPVPVPSTVDYNPSNPPAGNVAQSPIPIVPAAGTPPSTPSTAEPSDNCAMY